MKALLDQREIGQQPSVATALDVARQQAAAAGRVIIEVKLDGVGLSDAELDAPDTSPSRAELIECISADPRALVAMSFEQASTALDEARAIQRDAAGALQSGQTDLAFGLLAEAIGVWEAVKQVLDQAPALLGVSAQSLCPKGTNFESAMLELVSGLSALKATLAMQDWATLADLLNVELDQQAEIWTGLLAQMAVAARRLEGFSTTAPSDSPSVGGSPA